MNDTNLIVPGLESCNRKCRKCRWRDGFSGECMLMARAAKYIKRLESGNSEKIVYCKDCMYCEMEMRPYMYHGTDRYTCKNRYGLPPFPDLSPLDFCSRGMAKEGLSNENA